MIISFKKQLFSGLICTVHFGNLFVYVQFDNNVVTRLELLFTVTNWLIEPRLFEYRIGSELICILRSLISN